LLFVKVTVVDAVRVFTAKITNAVKQSLPAESVL
jgi:hypothetical protein